jgi:hypothetical protein
MIAVEVSTPRVGDDDQVDGPMGVDMVRAVLGIILDDEDRCLGPELALRDPLDDPP